MIVRPHIIQVVINVTQQSLSLYQADKRLKQYCVSTALKGTGQEKDSAQTPLGQHKICAKIGAGQPKNSVFVGRRFTGEILTPQLFKKYPDRDWILSRIIWLSGCELGQNRLYNVDTMARYIYIHGTPHEDQLGSPVSHGCIRMGNDDVIELFEQVQINCPVSIIKE